MRTANESNTTSRPVRRLPSLVWVLAASAWAAAGTPLPAQVSTAEAVATTRATLEQWVATRALVSKETRDWVLGKEALVARMDVIKREIVALQKRIAEAEANIAEADRKRRELQAENEQRKATAAGLEQRIAGLEQRLLQTLPRLPEPLQAKVKPLTQRVPRPGEATAVPLGDRYAAVIGVLNEIHKWNREVTVTSEVRALPDGSSVEVAVLYAGLGQAWYVGGNGRVAGTGVATADSWQWRQANELAPAIQRAIAVFKNEQPAAFVPLPVQVQ
jgi:hypothetical protein